MIMLEMADIMRILEAFGRASPSDRDGSRSTPSVDAIKQGSRHEKKRLSPESTEVDVTAKRFVGGCCFIAVHALCPIGFCV
jgi:hypothetical protein